MKKITIIAPSSCATDINEHKVKTILSFFQKLKLKINFSKYAFEKKYFFAGTEEQRISDLEAAFAEQTTDAIMILRGGAGSLHLLDKINYKAIAKHPKAFFGFSDTTALQNAFYAKIGMPSFSGFWARIASEPVPSLTQKTLLKCLNNEKQCFRVPFIANGKANGILLGGNLRILTSLLGTPYFPDMKNKILIVEDVGEAAYRLDNMLMQLRLAGVFDKINGLILGDFSQMSKRDEQIANRLIKEYFSNAPYPVARFKKYSHEPGHVVIPMGGMAHLDSKKGTLLLDKLTKMK